METTSAILRRALALSSKRWNGDLQSLIGEAVDLLAADAQPAGPQAALDALRELQRTVQPGEPFADPQAWAKRATADEVRRALSATLERLQRG